jgi:hypothetical protein
VNLIIDLPDELGAALKAKALQQGVSPAETLRVLEEAVKLPEGRKRKPKKSGYGLLALYGPGPSEEEIDEDRREMFRGFGPDMP